MRVTALSVYPVKSLEGVSLEAAAVEPRGLRGDRRWGLVEPDGTQLTAREERALLALRAVPIGEGSVRILDREGGAITVEPPREAAPIPVGHRGQGAARPCGAEVDLWLSAWVGRQVRLVWQDDESRRPVRPDRGGETGDTLSLADAGPVLLTSDASLSRLNEWLAEGGSEPLGHDRFRPNVVIDGAAPFAEDQWDVVTVGQTAFRTTMVCDRCVMTTIDRHSLETTREPIRTLARHRGWDGATWFGTRLTPVLPLRPDALLRVGDPVLSDGEPDAWGVS